MEKYFDMKDKDMTTDSKSGAPLYVYNDMYTIST